VRPAGGAARGGRAALRIALAGLGGLLGSAVSARAEFSVAGRLESGAIREDEPTAFELEIVWGEADLVSAVGEPSVPPLEGLILVGRSVSERAEITAGGVPLHRRVYRFELRPSRRGTARIGPTRVEFSFASGQTQSLSSAPLELEVRAAPRPNLLPAWLGLGAFTLAALGVYVWWSRRRGAPAAPPDPLGAELEQALQAVRRGDRSGAGERIYGLIVEQLKRCSGGAPGSDPLQALQSCGLEAPLASGLRETLETLQAARYGRQPAEAEALELAARRAAELLDRTRREKPKHG